MVTFNINLYSIKESYFWFPRLSGVTMVTSLSRSSRDFLKLYFYMSLQNTSNTKFQRNQSGGLGVISI